MLRDRVLFTGTSSVSHPVLDHLFGGPLDPPKDGKSADPILIVVDARLSGSDFGVARKALEEGVPVLVIAPSEGQLDPLASVIGVTPNSPAQAVFITPSRNRKEKTRYEATALAYSSARGTTQWLSKDTKVKGDDDVAKSGAACGCEKGASSGDPSVVHFTRFVESRLSKGYNPAPLALPDGLKYFQTTWNSTNNFTSNSCDPSNHCFKNGPGALAVSYVIWGFLNQTASSSSQYLVLESNYGLSPGTLAQNDDEGVGYVNIMLESSANPTSGGFAATNHIPTNGTGSWNENFTLNINYQDPLGGYQIYVFSATVNQSIDSWSVQNESSGAAQGSMWFVNSPMNGSNFSTWQDAFTTWGHVNPFPSASTGTLTMQEASAWQTSTIQSGNVTVNLAFDWVESMFYSTSCGLLICYKENALPIERVWTPSFTVNFSSITPS